MKHRKSKGRAGLGALALVLAAGIVVSQVQPFQALARRDSQAGQKLSAQFVSELSEDRRSSKIMVSVSSRDTVRVLGITLPNGVYIPGSKAVYTAVRNGRQDFMVDYEENVQQTDDSGNGGTPSGNTDKATPDSAKMKAEQNGASEAIILSSLIPMAHALNINTSIQPERRETGDSANPQEENAPSSIPAESELSSESDRPTEPEQPTEPDTPSEPEQSTEPETPGESEQPTESENPSGTVQPGTPDEEDESIDEGFLVPLKPSVATPDQPDYEVIRRSQVFSYEVTGINEAAQPFVSRALFPEDGMEVLVTAEMDVFPMGAEARITRIADEEKVSELQDKLQAELPASELIFQTVFYDIVILDGDGNKIQPDLKKGKVKVAFNKLAVPEALDAEEDGTELMTVLDEPEGMETNQKIAVFDKENKPEFLKASETDSGVETEAPHFSVYAVTMTKGFTRTDTITDGTFKDLQNEVVYTVTPAAGKTEVVMEKPIGSPIDVNGVTAVINIPKGVTLKVRAKSWGSPGIWIAPGSTLVVVGEGVLESYGAPAGGGKDGKAGSPPSNDIIGGGGDGGDGGCGGGAGIGGVGGLGGSGGRATRSRKMNPHEDYVGGERGLPWVGPEGRGQDGAVGTGMGTLFVLDKVTVMGQLGEDGIISGGAGGRGSSVHARYAEGIGTFRAAYGITGGAGGGGGGSGGRGDGIGGGGGGGGGGGAGTTGAATADKVSPVYFAGNGGGGGEGWIGDAGGGTSERPHGVYDPITTGNNGTIGNNYPGTGGAPATITLTSRYAYGNWDWSSRRDASEQGGTGGEAGNSGDRGKVYKSAGATVIGRPNVENAEEHPAVKYRLTGVATPTDRGSVAGGGVYMYNTTHPLTATSTYWRTLWDDGSTSATLNVKMDQFNDITRTAKFVLRKRLEARELSGDTEKGQEAYRFILRNTKVDVDFKVTADIKPLQDRPRSEVQMLTPDGNNAIAWDHATWSDRLRLRMPAVWSAGFYPLKVDGVQVGGLRVGTYFFEPLDEAGSELILKPSDSAERAASSKVRFAVNDGNGSQKVMVKDVRAGAGEVPIEIVPKSEVEANKDRWTPEEAVSKIALEINGTEYRPGTEVQLEDGRRHIVTIYNANTTRAVSDRTLKLVLLPQSDGQEATIDIPLLTEAAGQLNLIYQLEAMENNPITGVSQQMAEPTLTGWGTGRYHNITASEAGQGYMCTGWWDGATRLSTERNFTYIMPNGVSEKTLMTSYCALGNLEDSSITGEYFLSAAGEPTAVSKQFRMETLKGGTPIAGQDYMAYAGDMELARRNGATEEVAQATDYQVTSWVGEDLTVRLDSSLAAGVYYPKFAGITQGRSYPGDGSGWLGISKLEPAVAGKTGLVMKASPTLDTVASDRIGFRLETPYDDVTDLTIKSIMTGTTDRPLLITPKTEVEANRTDWGWAEAQQKAALEMNGVPLAAGQTLTVTGENTLVLYNANAIKDAFTTKVRLEVELTRTSGTKLTTTLTIPIEVQPTQISASVPMSITLAVMPDGKVVSPTNFAIHNKTAIPLEVESLSVAKEESSTVNFTKKVPLAGARNEFYGVVNAASNQYYLADLESGTAVNWRLEPGSTDAPASLGINFDGSVISVLEGEPGGWPSAAKKVFSMHYTLAPMK